MEKDEKIAVKSEISKTRDVILDLIGTVHLEEAYEKNQNWECDCEACQYLRSLPRLVDAIYRVLNNRN